ncbi:MAG: hypothetical protein IT372_00330 [Polyangiaceae bacterium]|nr:hypothetical protein [Polyangiaceae bacterium]
MGCGSAQEAAPFVPPVPPEATPQSDPLFSAAVDAHAIAVSRLRGAGEDAGGAGMRAALERLADAIAAAPGAGDRGAAALAQRIRVDTGLSLLGLRVGPSGEDAVQHALTTGAEALGLLAAGRCGRAPGLCARMDALDDAVARLRARATPKRAEAIATIQQAALVLAELRAASMTRPADSHRGGEYSTEIRKR